MRSRAAGGDGQAMAINLLGFVAAQPLFCEMY